MLKLSLFIFIVIMDYFVCLKYQMNLFVDSVRVPKLYNISILQSKEFIIKLHLRFATTINDYAGPFGIYHMELIS